MSTKVLTFPTVVRADGDEPEITISTGAVDREGDILEPDGAELSEYQRNPVVGFGHFRHELIPVGATTTLKREGRGLRAKWKWLRNDPMADRVRNAFEQGVLRAASVGFQPLAYEPRQDGRGLRFTRWNLLEWSLVPVPANPEAVRTLKALGLPVREDAYADDTVLELLDDEPTISVDAHEVAHAIRAGLSDFVSRSTYEAVCELTGRIPDPNWQPPRLPSLAPTRAAGQDASVPDGLTAQQQAQWNLRMERQRIREESEERSRQLSEARRIAERTARAALPPVGVGPFGGNTPELVDVGDGWLVPRMPGAWRR